MRKKIANSEYPFVRVLSSMVAPLVAAEMLEENELAYVIVTADGTYYDVNLGESQDEVIYAAIRKSGDDSHVEIGTLLEGVKRPVVRAVITHVNALDRVPVLA